MSIVVFNYATWAARYPELAATVNPTLAGEYFNEAVLYCDNTACSPVPYDLTCTPPVTTRATLLNMVTAHIAALNMAGSSPLVGRISDATEGTVNVKAAMDNQPQSAAWWQQTKYGAAFWAASAQFRQMRYVPGPQPFFQPAGPPFAWRGY